MAEPTYVVIFIGLGLALLAATTIPAPSRPSEHEVPINLTLLATAVAVTTLMGALALSHLHVESVICGAIAWLIVMPCLWLARAPRPAEGWGGGGEDDEPLPGLDPTGPFAAGVAPTTSPTIAVAPGAAPAPIGAWAIQPAATTEAQPFAAHPELAEDAVDVEPAWHPASEPVWPPAAEPESPPAAEPVWQPPAEPASEPVGAASGEDTAGAVHRRVLAPPRRVRGDHRSIAHVNGAGVHDTGRRRRASLHRRLLQRWRSWLWAAPPEGSAHAPSVAPEHDARRHSWRPDARREESESRSVGV